jgi:hypothetical protein
VVIGASLGKALANGLELPPLVCQVTLGFSLGTLLLAGGRVSWGLFVGTGLVFVAYFAVAGRFLPAVGDSAAAAMARSSSDWLGGAWDWFWEDFATMWDDHRVAMLLVFVIGYAAPLAGAIAFGEWAHRVGSSVCGGVLLIGGLIVMATATSTRVWHLAFSQWYAPAILAAGTAAFGVFAQTQLARDQAERSEAGEQAVHHGPRQATRVLGTRGARRRR